jgi:uncharacterized membrane protein
MFGYDWPRLHAALNDLPTALIVMGALIALIDQFLRRDSLRAAGYWMIVLGWAGTIAAVIAGLRAEGLVAHGGDAHEAFSRHKTMGLITFAAITAVALWRVAREKKMRAGEQSIVMGLTLAAAGLVVSTSQIGGDLVYDHALGIETSVLQQALDSRAAGHAHAEGVSHAHDETAPDAAAPAAGAPATTAGDSARAGDSAQAAGAPADTTTSTGSHPHAPGTPAHDH